MNDRLTELMKIAGTDSSGKWMGVDNAEAFAKLIIKECITAVEEKTNRHHIHTSFDNGLVEATISKSKIAIKQHFGVE
jgi:hypothetical protein